MKTESYESEEPASCDTAGNQATKEMRIFGPPGTGKTTTVARQIEAAAKKVGSQAVMVCSFTKAAAAELKGRDLVIDAGAVGTMHSHAYRALDSPELAETRVKEWNKLYPELALKAAVKQGRSVEDPFGPSEGAGDEAAVDIGKRGPGDHYMERSQWHRVRMTPAVLWPPAVREFHELWTKFKRGEDLLDFTDLLEACLREVPVHPRTPKVGFLDEAQDCSPLMMALWRRWSEHMESSVIVGDEDQTIYQWAGASAKVMLEPALDPRMVRVLDQSWRVPRSVWKVAQQIVGDISERYPKNYLPRDTPGSVDHLDATWKRPEGIARAIEQRLGQGKSCIVLAPCGYMLDGVIGECRSRGIPIYNPLRRHNGRWNPLQRGSETRRTTLDRALAFLAVHPNLARGGEDGLPRERWSGAEASDWLGAMQSRTKTGGVLARGSKTALLTIDRGGLFGADELIDYFAPEMREEAARAMAANDLEWFAANSMEEKKAAYSYIARVVHEFGERALYEPPHKKALWSGDTVPWAAVGTVHSFKGGEADSVILIPDLSWNAVREWECGDRDSVLRLFYVAVTRAREELLVCEPDGKAFPMQRYMRDAS